MSIKRILMETLVIAFFIASADAETFTYTLSYDAGSRVTLITAGENNQASYDWKNDKRTVIRSGEEPIGLFLWDIDGDGQAKPLTDGLLTLRYLFGFRDSALISNAVDTSATRTTAVDIQTYLQSGVDSIALDIDDNGEVKPLTDGLLVLRHLFGFSGDSLINNAVGDGANRSSANDVEAYLQSKMP